MIQPDIVYIDTSVFYAENFFAPDNRISSLCKLAKENKINIVLTEITRQEVCRQIKTIVRQSWKAFNRDSRIFRNNSDIDKWRKATNEKKEIEKITSLLDDFLTESHAKILDYSYCSNSEKVFTDYFEGKKPFGEGRKKDEFPDAFMLTSLEKYSLEMGRHIIVLSDDGDMEGYESKLLDYENYGEYVSRKVAEGIALDELAKQLRDEIPLLESKIKDEVIEYLDDFRLYQTLLDLTEVSYQSVNEVMVDIDEDDYEVVSVNDHFIDIEIQPEISFKVDVDYVSYEYAVYDREDGKWYGTEEEKYKVDSSAPIYVQLRFYYDKDHIIDYIQIEDMDMSSLSDAIK